MDIVKKAVAQAITLLHSTGSRYHVIEADGTVHGAPIEPEKKPRTRRIDPSKPSYRLMLRDKVGTMQVGDVVVLHPAEGDTLERLQGHASSYGTHIFGSGGFMTMQKNGTLEVLRVK